MRQRVGLLLGTIQIGSLPGHGTKVTAMLLCRGAPPRRHTQAGIGGARPGACSRRGGPEALQPPRLRQDRHPIRSPRSVSGRRRPAGGGSQTSACVIQRGGAILPLSAFDRGVRTRRSGHRAPPNSARHRPASCDRGASGGRRALWWLRVCRSSEPRLERMRNRRARTTIWVPKSRRFFGGKAATCSFT